MDPSTNRLKPSDKNLTFSLDDVSVNEERTRAFLTPVSMCAVCPTAVKTKVGHGYARKTAERQTRLRKDVRE